LWSLVTEQDGSVVLDSSALPELPAECPIKLQNLIYQCFDEDPSKRPLFSSLITSSNTFDEVFYEASVNGAELFLRMWDDLTIEQPAWLDFLPAFCKTFNMPHTETTQNTVEFQCLKHMLDCDNNNQLVLREAFERLLKCIGPFIEGEEIIDQVKSLLEMSWFMGNLTAFDAEKKLKDLPNRAFLVRFSSNTGEFTVTFKQKHKILHSRVPTSAKYNLQQYVNLLQQKKKFKVTPPSPFGHLFVRTRLGYHSWTFVR